MPGSIPTDFELYNMNHLSSRLRVGGVVYGWDESLLNQRWQDLPIHQRKDVAVNGHDIVESGFNGPIVDAIFSSVEQAIILGQLDNNKAAIKEWIEEKFNEHQ
jgi:tRNA nucleotidyltransferase (CCA-adding enzyme)